LVQIAEAITLALETENGILVIVKHCIQAQAVGNEGGQPGT
jgi:hypothetical protein